METLIEQLRAVGTDSLGAFWLPLMAWTLMAVPVFLGLKFWKSAHPLVQYYAHRALLLALPLAFLLAPVLPVPSFAPASLTFGLGGDAPSAPIYEEAVPLKEALPPADAIAGEADVTGFESVPKALVEAGPEDGPSVPWLIVLLGILSGAAFLLAALRFALLLHQAYALRRFHAGLRSVEHVGALHLVERLRGRLGIRRPVALFTGGDNDVPMTFGWRRPTIVLPAALLRDEQALEMALLHEMVHISRGDFAWGVLERLVCCLFAIHPGVWLLYERIGHFREASCDSEVLASQQADVRNYASLLVSFHRSAPVAGTAALSMVKPGSNLKQRIAAMKQFKNIKMTSRMRRNSVIFGVLLLILPAFITACYTRVSSSTEVVKSDEEADAAFNEEADVAFNEEVPVAGFTVELDDDLEAQIAAEAEKANIDKRTVEADLARYRAQMLIDQRMAAEQELMQGLARRKQLPEDLRRLEVQIDYLTEQLKSIELELGALHEGRVGQEDLHMTASQLNSRRTLLQRMYNERMERYEMMKMEVETERRLREDNTTADAAVSAFGVLKRAPDQSRIQSSFQRLNAEVLHKIQSIQHQMAERELHAVQLARELEASDDEGSRLELRRAMEATDAQMQAMKAEMEALQRHMEELQQERDVRWNTRVESDKRPSRDSN